MTLTERSEILSENEAKKHQKKNFDFFLFLIYTTNPSIYSEI